MDGATIRMTRVYGFHALDTGTNGNKLALTGNQKSLIQLSFFWC